MVICLNYAFVNQIVRRNGKWKVTKEQFSGDKYPAGCNGAGIVFTRKAAEKILKQSSQTISFHLDDMYISGILRLKAGIPLFRPGLGNVSIFVDEKTFENSDTLTFV